MENEHEKENSISTEEKQKAKMGNKTIWKPEEEKILIDTITENGCDWKLAVKNLITKGYSDKTSKQCRERWLHYLNPEMRMDDFTPKEEEYILTAHKAECNKWVNIARNLPGRSDNMIKNFFYSKVRKEIRRLNNEFKQDEQFKKIHVNQITYFRLLRKLDTSVFGLTTFPLSEIGTVLIGKNKSKKIPPKIIKKIQKKADPKRVLAKLINPDDESDGLKLPDYPAPPPVNNDSQIIVPEAIVPEIMPYEGSLISKSQYIDKMSSSPPLMATQFSSFSKYNPNTVAAPKRYNSFDLAGIFGSPLAQDPILEFRGNDIPDQQRREMNNIREGCDSYNAAHIMSPYLPLPVPLDMSPSPFSPIQSPYYRNQFTPMYKKYNFPSFPILNLPGLNQLPEEKIDKPKESREIIKETEDMSKKGEIQDIHKLNLASIKK